MGTHRSKQTFFGHWRIGDLAWLLLIIGPLMCVLTLGEVVEGAPPAVIALSAAFSIGFTCLGAVLRRLHARAQ